MRKGARRRGDMRRGTGRKGEMRQGAGSSGEMRSGEIRRGQVAQPGKVDAPWESGMVRLRRPATVLVLLLAAADLALAAAAWTRQPWTNGPAEWRWQYVGGDAVPAAGAAHRPAVPPAPGPAAGGEGHGLAVVVAAAALGGLGLLAAWRNRAAGRLALVLAIACGTAFTFALVAVQPGGFGRVVGALVSRNSFGYLWDAALAPPTRALLADYPAASEGLNQHSVTHPPGPILAVRALAWLDPLLPPSPQTGLPGAAAGAVQHEVERARNHRRPVPAEPPGAWSVAAFALLLPLLSALAAWPLYRLALALGCPPPAALLAALLWLLVPARSLFTPSFDQALPLPLIGAAALAARGAAGGARRPRGEGQESGAVAGWRAAGDRAAWRAAGAGLLLFVACFLSYGSLPLLPLVLAVAAAAAGAAGAAGTAGTAANVGAQESWPAAPPGGQERRQPAVGASASGPARWVGAAVQIVRAVPLSFWAPLVLGFTLPYLILAALGHNPIQAMRAALALHHQIAVEPRSYTTWLAWDPYDLALLLSPAVLCLAAVVLAPRAAGEPQPPADPGRPAGAGVPHQLRLPAWTWFGLLALLWVSGNVRGEVGRIWLPWMPFACLFGAAVLHRQRPAPLLALLASLAALILALAASMVFVA